MSRRTTLVLLVMLAALGGAAAWLQGPGRADRPREKAPVFPALAPKEVQAVRVTRPDGPLLLARDGSGWAVGEERRPADAAAVERLLGDLAGLRESATASTNPAKRGLYGLAPGEGIGVQLEDAAGRALAAFRVGKTGPDFASSYLARDGEDRVLLVPLDLGAELGRPAEEFAKPAAAAPGPAAGAPPAGAKP